MKNSQQWNFAEVWETIAAQLDTAPALIHDDRVISWRSFDERADGVAQTLLDAGLKEQEKVAHYLYNCPEYIESLFGVWKAGLVPVNTNYRYVDGELMYLWNNADVRAVVFHGSFQAIIERLLPNLGSIKIWLWVDDGSGPCPGWAVPYEAAVQQADKGSVRGAWGRSGDHLYLLYTGGTTGQPKGVMWRQDDLFRLLNRTAKIRFPEEGSLIDVARMVSVSGPRLLPVCPIMHGTGALGAFGALSSGGAVITVPGKKLDVDELLNTVERRRVQVLSIVGDAFARPLVVALDSQPDRWDLSSLRIVTSSGVMWSPEMKGRLLAHCPDLILVDTLGSSEAVSVGSSVSKRGALDAEPGRFFISSDVQVIDDSGQPVEPGSDQVGLLAIRGCTPIGYYKDEAKSAATFREVDGERMSFPGDYAKVGADGSISLLGRGSQCINTGGEKVFPEEVEEVLKELRSVEDAAVLGLADERFGEAVIAVVQSSEITEDDVIRHVKRRLAPFKIPRRVFVVASLDRGPNGKLDYVTLRELITRETIS